MKKLSIVTVTYNDDKNLLKTIESIKKQNNNEFEFLIIDGNSKDNTNNIIKENLNIIDKFISEKDNGIYDAMNKGINLSSGQYILFLNSGDIFYNENSIKKIYDNVINKNLDIGYFDIILKYGEKSIIKKQPIIFNKYYLLYNNICHQSMIIKKSLFEINGFYNIKNKVFADYEFNYKLIKNNKIKIDGKRDIITEFDMSGVSSNLNFVKSLKNRFEIVSTHGEKIDKVLFIIFNLIFKPIDTIQRRIKFWKN